MTPLHRTSRERHYPQQLDVKDPFILLVHQGMVEDIFIEDLRERGIEITRSRQFTRYETDSSREEIIAICENTERETPSSFKTKYLVGCDGAHSNVRRSMPGAQTVGESTNARWGVLDGTSPISKAAPFEDSTFTNCYRSYRDRLSRPLEQSRCLL